MRHGELNINLRDDSWMYEQFTYPMGETQVRFRQGIVDLVRQADSITIRADIRKDSDIIRLALLKNAIDIIISHNEVRLILKYMPYSRADRPFVEGDCCGLAVFGTMINSMRFKEVCTLDVHNPIAAEKYIESLDNISPYNIIIKALVDFANRQNTDHIKVLFPDKGARDRYGNMLPESIVTPAKTIRLTFCNCDKRRNQETGKLDGFDVPMLGDEAYPVIIVDDLCDGGGTFIGIADELRFPEKCALYVTHGVFSKGTGELLKRFDRIYTSESIPALIELHGAKDGRLVVLDSGI